MGSDIWERVLLDEMFDRILYAIIGEEEERGGFGSGRLRVRIQSARLNSPRTLARGGLDYLLEKVNL